ncbi:diguanylate cyclase [Thioalkalivibrio sp. ALJT]|uniref:diguanylate cyclase n=1 Tax=Thioalkalivibrio sp. ALJT TaxID=1158146 RepID=UPI0003630CDD|nr:diguanylate cyclase [Thioalkalivibrio sp. ALJT]
MSNTHEWCEKGVTPQRDTLQSVQVDDHAWVTEQILQGETVHLPDITALPENRKERVELERQEIQSLLCLPLISNRRIYGFLGYDMVAHQREWTDAQLRTLKLVAEIIAGAFARLQSEMELKRSEAKHRTLFEATSDAVMLLDKSRFLDCNPATLAMFGCASRDEFITKHPAELSPPVQPGGTDSRTLADQHIRRALDLGSDLFEWQHRRMDGEIFTAEVLLTPMNMDGQQLLQAVVRDITERKRAQEELQRLSSIDGLTGVANRRRFDGTLERVWNQTVRSGGSIGLLLLDIDFFKRYNDHYGHLAGDDVLKAVAEAISSAVPRTTDLVARYGGEEFACILPATDLEGARTVAERIRTAISGLDLPHTTADAGRLTVSIGATAQHRPRPKQTGIMELIHSADQALYRAKEQGRDQVVAMIAQKP